jgi:hypothetical protein
LTVPDPIETNPTNVHISAQIAARKRHGYGPIWLYREGNRTVVAIKSHGEWVPVIREFFDDNFSHCIEPLGIEAELEQRSAKCPT